MPTNQNSGLAAAQPQPEDENRRSRATIIRQKQENLCGTRCARWVGALPKYAYLAQLLVDISLEFNNAAPSLDGEVLTDTTKQHARPQAQAG